MADFTTDDSIVSLMRMVTGIKTFAISDVPTFLRAASYQEIVERSGNDWSVSIADEVVTLSGDGTNRLFLPKDKIPIISLTSIIVTNKEATTTTINIDQSDDERNMWYDIDTGLIELIRPVEGIQWGYDLDYKEVGVWPDGVANIAITGRFGQEGPASILNLLQNFIILRSMSRLNPQKYGSGDIVGEKIGKYSYELTGKGTSASKRMSLDEMIDYYFTLLPIDDFYYGAI